MDKSKEFKRGYDAAKKAISKGEDVGTLLNQVRSSLTNDDFDKGFKEYLKEQLKIVYNG